mmetsp:Transcript_19692/g.59036  ORF Transcript_19692/g.59036 Transcript_19692/m.59036 type:complete len:240 (-) Transcript_19692:34-753(-)
MVRLSAAAISKGGWLVPFDHSRPFSLWYRCTSRSRPMRSIWHIRSVRRSTTPALKEYTKPCFHDVIAWESRVMVITSLRVIGRPCLSIFLAATTAAEPGVRSSSSRGTMTQMSLSRCSTCFTPNGRKMRSAMKRRWLARLKMRSLRRELVSLWGWPSKMSCAKASTVAPNIFSHFLGGRRTMCRRPSASWRLGASASADAFAAAHERSPGSAVTTLHDAPTPAFAKRSQVRLPLTEITA